MRLVKGSSKGVTYLVQYSNPKLSTSCCVIDGMTVTMSTATIVLDMEGLKLILAQVVHLSNPWRIHLLPGTDVVMVRSFGGLLYTRLGQGPFAFYLG